jgi:uracil-DNA glycosylase family 4
MGWEPSNDWRQELTSALEWWADAGVDTLIEDEPRDWLARPAARVETVAESAPAVTATPLPDTIDAFVAWRMSDDAPEAEWLTPRIPPSGLAAAPLMILTDMPEPEDSETGVLMSGAPGRLLDRILAAIGTSRDSVYLASLATARPLTGRIPPEAEAQLIDLARHHIALAAPKKLLLLGQAAARVQVTTNGSASGNGEGDINPLSREMEVVATYHPRFLLERPAAKAEAWKDLMQFNRGERP